MEKRKGRKEIRVECDGMNPFFMRLRTCKVGGKGMMQADLSLALHLQEWDVIEERGDVYKVNKLYIKCRGIRPFKV